MAMMLVQCPETGKTVSTGVDIDQFSFINLGISPLIVRKCPSCGSAHVMTTREAWLGELSASEGECGTPYELETERQVAG